MSASYFIHLVYEGLLKNGIRFKDRIIKPDLKIEDKVITTNTKVKQSVLDDYRNRKAEWYIESDEAIALGFAHKIKK